jgi:hypothetical protein
MSRERNEGWVTAMRAACEDKNAGDIIGVGFFSEGKTEGLAAYAREMNVHINTGNRLSAVVLPHVGFDITHLQHHALR